MCVNSKHANEHLGIFTLLLKSENENEKFTHMVDSLGFPNAIRTTDRDRWMCLKVTLKQFQICVGIETAVVTVNCVDSNMNSRKTEK